MAYYRVNFTFYLISDWQLKSKVTLCPFIYEVNDLNFGLL